MADKVVVTNLVYKNVALTKFLYPMLILTVSVHCRAVIWICIDRMRIRIHKIWSMRSGSRPDLVN